MRVELARQRMKVRQQVAIQVYYEGEVVGEFVPDLWVEDRVLVELKGGSQPPEGARSAAGQLPHGHQG